MNVENIKNIHLIKEIFYDSQNTNYKNKIFRPSTLIMHDELFYEFQAYMYILNRILKINEIENTLEIGCGPGFLTPCLSLVSKKVYSFDISEEGIKHAKLHCKNYRNVELFIADGILSDKIQNLKIKFDFILSREFHPFTRKQIYNSFESSQILHQKILDSYLLKLRKNGIMMIIHRITKGSYPFQPLLKDNYELLLKNLDIRILKRIVPFFRNKPNIIVNLSKTMNLFKRNNGYGFQNWIIQKKY